MKIKLFILAVLLFATASVVANEVANIVVGGVAPQEITWLHVPARYSTIQSCVNAAQSGQGCLVEPGTYGNTTISRSGITAGTTSLSPWSSQTT